MKPSYVTTLLGLSLWGASLSVQACSYDGQFNNPFKESYPGALDIAIATQDALSDESLEHIKVLEGAQGLRRASWWLTLMTKHNANDLESVSYIYLVDSHLWSKVSNGDQIEIHVPPNSDDASSVLLLSEAALQALVSQKVDLQSAIELGIAQIAG